MPRGYQLDHPASFMSSIQNEDYSHNIHGEFSTVFLTDLSRTFAPHTPHSARLPEHHCQQGDFLSHGIMSIITNMVAESLVSYDNLHAQKHLQEGCLISCITKASGYSYYSYCDVSSTHLLE